ncbi:MAG TPA: hypothetical protein VNL39_14980 [Xanthobacteraceae bacterium]|nr:hypothetical protein [Xanthobacteraceae bacterium]
MAQTRAQAIGGSGTAENLADMKVDPSVVLAIFHGDIGAAARRGFDMVTNVLHEATPEVRAHIARLLLQRGPNPALQGDIAEAMNRISRNRMIGEQVARALIGGTAVSAPYMMSE